MRVLLIGFGPFPGAPLNPSALLVKSLTRRRRPAFAEIVRTTHVFATTYAAVDRDLPKLLAAGPDIVLMFGVAGRRRHLSIETRARNAVSLLFPDARGCRPRQGIIAPGKPAVLRGAAPFARLLGAVRASTRGCRAMLGAISATTPIGARWNGRATAGHSFSSFTSRPFPSPRVGSGADALRPRSAPLSPAPSGSLSCSSQQAGVNRAGRIVARAALDGGRHGLPRIPQRRARSFR